MFRICRYLDLACVSNYFYFGTFSLNDDGMCHFRVEIFTNEERDIRKMWQKKLVRYVTVFPLLQSLHWFPTEQKIQVKMCVIVYKVMYVSSLIQFSSSFQTVFSILLVCCVSPGAKERNGAGEKREGLRRMDDSDGKGS